MPSKQSVVKKKTPPRGLPSRDEILAFIAKSPFPVGKREIAKAFKVQSQDRVALKGVLKDIERTGIVARGPKRRFAPPGALPEIAVIDVVSIDDQGEPVCRLLGNDDDQPVIRIGRGGSDGALGLGERAVARLSHREDGSYVADIVRRLEKGTERILGVFTRDRDGSGTLTPTDRRNKTIFRVEATKTLDATHDELVLATPLQAPRLGLPLVQIVERLGSIDDPRSISLIAIHTQSIPVDFPADAIAEAEAAQPVALGDRTDLRQIPLITIDGADARDFDDAVWAAPDEDPANEGGWHVLVAIADVAWYVRPGSPLDRTATERGNSVYFPDRVVPMLPEALSNELCSLKPDVERACLAIHMWFDKDGEKIRHKVVRGLMRSAARLTYEEVQAVMDGTPDGPAAALKERVIEPLYRAFHVLDKARRARGTLDLDLPERKIRLGEDGKIAAIERRLRLDSHRLIEEFMIAANVAAAEALEAVQRPCMYRVHDTPDPERVDALRKVLDSIGAPGLKLAAGQSVRPRQFSAVLTAAEGRPEAPMINELVLRCQAQAAYAPDNLGHFGLALRRYAHFTSPIRRYADLIVHRSLIQGLGLGEGGLPPTDPETLAELGTHISQTERRAMLAERIANDRYIVAFMQDRVGASFEGRISGVARFGLFVALDETGADGLIPIGSLPNDYYNHDERAFALVGQKSRRRFTLGDRVTVTLLEANPVQGGLVFRLSETAPSPARPGGAPRFLRGRGLKPRGRRQPA